MVVLPEPETPITTRTAGKVEAGRILAGWPTAGGAVSIVMPWFRQSLARTARQGHYPAAARSVNQCSVPAGCTRAAGREASPARTRASTSRLSAPATRKAA